MKKTRENTRLSAGVRFVVLAGQATVTVSIPALLAGYLSRYWSNGPTVREILWAALSCLVMSVISLVPVVFIAQKKAEWLALAFLAGSGIRLFSTLITATIVYMLLIEPERMALFAMTVVGFYLVLLGWETMIALKLVKRRYGIRKEKEGTAIVMNYTHRV